MRQRRWWLPCFRSVQAMAQGVKEKEQAKQADFLFVQTAKGMTFDKSTNKLTLDGMAPSHPIFLRPPRAHRRQHEDHRIRAVLE